METVSWLRRRGSAPKEGSTLRPANQTRRAELLALSDASLIELVRAGDHGAFEGIMRRYNPRLFRIARSITRDDAEAEEAVQEAYFKAYRALDSVRADAAFATWLTRILVHEASARRRKRARESVGVDDALLESSEPALHSAMPTSPDEDAERAGVRQRVEAALDELPEVYRSVFVCRAMEDLDTDETAAVLGVTPEVVRVRLFRARGELRRQLGAEVEECARAWGFDGARCDRLVGAVLARIDVER